MTDVEILAKCINTLGKINIPVDLTDQIAIPIRAVYSDLILLYKAISEIREKKAEENAESDDPQEIREKKAEENAESDDPQKINQNESGESE